MINRNKIAKTNFIQNSIHQNQETNFNHLKEVLNIKQENLNQEKENLVFSAFSDTNLIKQEINVAKELRLTHLNYYHSSLQNNLILKKSENEKTHLQKLNTIDLSFNLYFLNSFFKKEIENAKLFFSTNENSFVKLIEIVEDFFTVFNKNDMSKILNFDFILNYANSLNKHNYNIAMLLKAVITEIEQDFFVKEQISDFELFDFNSYIAETMSLVLSFQFKRTLDIVNLQAEKILNKVIQEAENWLIEIKQNQLKVMAMLKTNQKEYEVTLKQIVATTNVDEISFQSIKEFFKAIKKVQANAEFKIKTNTAYFTENIISRLAELKKMKSSDFFDAFYFSDHFKNLSDQYFRKTMHTTSVQTKAVRDFQTKFTDEFKNLIMDRDKAERLIVKESIISDTDLEGFDMTNITFKLCSFENCNLTGADFSGSSISGTLFRECPMHGCKFVGSDMTEAIFRDIDLSDSDLDLHSYGVFRR